MNASKAIPNTAQTQWVEITQGKKRTLPARKPQDEIDNLIAWYEKNKPDMPHVIPGGVAMGGKGAHQVRLRDLGGRLHVSGLAHHAGRRLAAQREAHEDQQGEAVLTQNDLLLRNH